MAASPCVIEPERAASPHDERRSRAGATPPRALPPVWMTLLVAVAMQVPIWPYHGVDVDGFLQPWFDHLRRFGPVASFAHPFSNYMPLYLYLMAATSLFAPLASVVTLLKLLSTAGTLALVTASVRLLRVAGAAEPWRGAALVGLLPTVALNAGLLVQCDAMYTAALVMAVAGAVAGRPRAMLGWFGLAVGFKLQAAFAGPFVLAWLLRERVPVRWWPLAPAVTLATLVPAALAGWPVADLLTIYLRQAGTCPQLSLSAPNLWELVRGSAGEPAMPFGAAYAAAVGAAAAYVGWGCKRLPAGAALVGPAALSVMVVAGLLPMMHERYFFAADVLALAAALIRRDRIGWAVMALVETGSALALLAYLTDARGFAAAGAAAMMIATWLLARPLIAERQAWCNRTIAEDCGSAKPAA